MHAHIHRHAHIDTHKHARTHTDTHTQTYTQTHVHTRHTRMHRHTRKEAGGSWPFFLPRLLLVLHPQTRKGQHSCPRRPAAVGRMPAGQKASGLKNHSSSLPYRKPGPRSQTGSQGRLHSSRLALTSLGSCQRQKKSAETGSNK